jgi:hypothetical protein
MIIEYMPESPKYLYILKRYRKAREILVNIGQKYNRVTIRAVFREEARD